MSEELVVLGTGAAEGIPGLFCTCEICREAAQRQGRNLRMRASYQFGSLLKVDWPPDSLAQMMKFDLDYSRLRRLLITHSHYDHFFPKDLDMRRPGFSRPGEHLLHLYGNQAVLAMARRALKRWRPHRLAMHRVSAGDRLNLDGYAVTAVRAQHAEDEAALNYVVERDGFAVLVGNDTGWYPDSTWDALTKTRLDVVLLDCTYGCRSQRHGHLGCPDVVEAKREMEQRGILKPGARFIATHFSHNGGLLHEELEQLLSPEGIEVAYDGMHIPLQAPSP